MSPQSCLGFLSGEHPGRCREDARLLGRALEPGLSSDPSAPLPPAHRRNKVLNHFSIMQQRRLKDQDHDEEDEEKDKRGRKKASELRIHDLEDDLEMSSDDSEASGEEGELGQSPALVAGVVGTTA